MRVSRDGDGRQENGWPVREQAAENTEVQHRQCFNYIQRLRGLAPQAEC